MRRAVIRTPVALGIILAAATAGCASTDLGAPAPLTPLSRYSLQVEPGMDRIALAVHEEGLSRAQHHALFDLADRYRASGTGWLNVEAPDGGDPAAARQAYAAKAVLESAGVPGDRIQVTAYPGPDPRAPVLAGFATLHASIPDCAAMARDLGPRFSNQSTANLGCAITANMAAQIADPRDILGAKPMTPADSGRAAVVFSDYRRGETSSTPQEPLVAGRIAKAVE